MDKTMRVGVISDTHGLLRPEAVARLAGVDHILHAGDIGRPEVIEALSRIAPTTAVRGNVDTGHWAAAYPDRQSLTLGGHAVLVLHDIKTLDLDPAAWGLRVVVSGHSHQPRCETVDGVLYLNPGSAGRRRFRLPISLATLDITGQEVRAHLHELEC